MNFGSIQAVVNTPFVDSDGRITREAYYFLLSISNSITGGPSGSGGTSINDLQIMEEFSSLQSFEQRAAVGSSDSVLTWLNA